LQVLLPIALVNFSTFFGRTAPMLKMSNSSQPVLTWHGARTAARVLEAHSLYKRAKGPAWPDGFDSPAFRSTNVAKKNDCPYNSQRSPCLSEGSLNMIASHVEESAVNSLLSSGKLKVSGSYKWKRGDNKSWGKLEVPVESEDETAKDVNLRIIVTISFANQDKRDFALLWNNAPVRRLCTAGSHTNRHTNNERWLRQVHKHQWTDNCMDRFAYTPTDITATDVQGQLSQFCKECGIRCSATLGELPSIQGGLYDEM